VNVVVAFSPFFPESPEKTGLTISSFPLSCVMSYVSSLPSTRSLPKHHYPRKPFTPKREEEKKKVLERQRERETKGGEAEPELTGRELGREKMMHPSYYTMS